MLYFCVCECSVCLKTAHKPSQLLQSFLQGPPGAFLKRAADSPHVWKLISQHPSWSNNYSHPEVPGPLKLRAWLVSCRYNVKGEWSWAQAHMDKLRLRAHLLNLALLAAASSESSTRSVFCTLHWCRNNLAGEYLTSLQRNDRWIKRDILKLNVLQKSFYLQQIIIVLKFPKMVAPLSHFSTKNSPSLTTKFNSDTRQKKTSR